MPGLGRDSSGPPRLRAELSHGTCHELRHTCFTRLREAGMAIEAIQAQAGHRSISSTSGSICTWTWSGWPRSTDGPQQSSRPGARGGGPINALARELPFEDPRRPGGGTPEVTWAEDRGPGTEDMVATMASYLDQLEVSARPGTVAAAEMTLRFFAHRVTEVDPACVSVAAHGRAHIEDFKSWLLKRRGRTGKPLATMTIRHRLSTVRTFFERIMEWDYDDAPARLFVYMSDFPALDEPLPKFLDDPTAAKFMAALAQDPNQRRRLMVELLARTGIRVGELAGLEDDAMIRKGGGHRLRIPIGKLHNDRYVPLLPMLVDLDYRVPDRAVVHARAISSTATTVGLSIGAPSIATWTASPSGPGSASVHPHQLRHTLATQSIDAGIGRASKRSPPCLDTAPWT